MADMIDAPAPGANGTGHNSYRSIRRLFAAVLLAFLAALGVRTFLVQPFSIPSESMEPTLLTGDYVLVTKWDYGLPIRTQGAFAGLPERGDVVVFRGDGNGGEAGHVVKRVLGLPGDAIELRGGQIWLNGGPLPRTRRPDFVLPVTAGMDRAADGDGSFYACFLPDYERRGPAGQRQCRFPRFAEKLPGRAAYDTLDLAPGFESDDMGRVIVPEAHLFVVGDNRDRSADSRIPADRPGAIGLVPVARVEGRAAFILFSVDGSAQIGEPGSWLRAVRWNRIGARLE